MKKKIYQKPTQHVITLHNRSRLLAGSVGGYDGRFIERKDDSNNYIFEEEDVW